MTSWSQDVINSLLLGIRVEGEDGLCEITDVSNIDGEASINNRKGKLIFFYEWNVKATWTGGYTEDTNIQISKEFETFHFHAMFCTSGTNKKGIKYKGTVEIPNLSDENGMDDLDVSKHLATPIKHFVYKTTNFYFCFIVQIRVTACKDQPITPLTELMRKEGVKKIRMALGNYVKQLKTGEGSKTFVLISDCFLCKLTTVFLYFVITEFSQGMILPTADEQSKQKESQAKVKLDKIQASSKG